MSIIGNPLILPSGGGGGGGLNGNWMGDNPTLMTGTGWSYSTTIYLKNTSYPAWTPSTTTTTILSAGTDPVIEIAHNYSAGYDYFLLCKVDVSVAYLSGATMLSAPTRFILVSGTEFFAYPKTYAAFVNHSVDSATIATPASRYYLAYYNASGVFKFDQILYGTAYVNSGASISTSSGSTSATYKIKLPAIYARCSPTYFDTARAAEVDVNNTTIKFDYSVYRIDAGTGANGQIYNNVSDILFNPL